jgi:hypothetical protein
MIQNFKFLNDKNNVMNIILLAANNTRFLKRQLLILDNYFFPS